MTTWNEFAGAVFKWFRRLFLIAKGLFIMYLSTRFVFRYKQTYKRWFQFETIMLLCIIILDMDIIVFEVWHSLNVIYSCFFLNSIMKMASAYYFQIKCMNSLRIKGYENV